MAAECFNSLTETRQSILVSGKFWALSEIRAGVTGILLLCLAGSHYQGQTSLKLAILLSQFPKCGAYRCGQHTQAWQDVLKQQKLQVPGVLQAENLPLPSRLQMSPWEDNKTHSLSLIPSRLLGPFIPEHAKALE